MRELPIDRGLDDAPGCGGEDEGNDDVEQGSGHARTDPLRRHRLQSNVPYGSKSKDTEKHQQDPAVAQHDAAIVSGSVGPRVRVGGLSRRGFNPAIRLRRLDAGKEMAGDHAEQSVEKRQGNQYRQGLKTMRYPEISPVSEAVKRWKNPSRTRKVTAKTCQCRDKSASNPPSSPAVSDEAAAKSRVRSDRHTKRTAI